MKRMAKRFLSSQALFVSKTLKPGKISPMMTVPSHIQRPPSPSKAFVDLPSVELLSKDELTTMRQTCKLAAKALIYAGSLAQVFRLQVQSQLLILFMFAAWCDY